MPRRSVHTLLALALFGAALAPLAFVAAEEPDYFVTSLDGPLLALSPGAQTVSLGDDMVSGGIPIGFRTAFFGNDIDTFWLGSNGFITLHFLTPDGCCGLQLPTPQAGPDGMVAAWWTDLDPSLGGQVRFDRQTLDGLQALVVDYRDVPVKGTASTASFQFILLQSGTFEVRIGNAVSASGVFASIGAENVDGSRGVQAFRESGASVANVGFRFVPNVPPVPPPVVHSIQPNVSFAGSGVQMTGENFASGVQVFVDGSSAFTSRFSSTLLFFQVPFLPAGVKDVLVRNPDGNETLVPGGLTVSDSLALHGVSPSFARQTDFVTIQGTAFTDAVVFLIGGRPLEPTFLTPTAAGVRLPADMEPGFKDVEIFDAQRGRFGLREAILVLGRPDLVVQDIEVTRPGIGTFATPTVPLPTQWTVDVTVTNAGDLGADDLVLQLASSASSQPQTAERSELEAGETWTATFFVGSGAEVGDYDFVAAIDHAGVRDRDPSNDLRTTTASAYVSGIRGPTIEPCLVVPRACMFPEERTHEVAERDQTDTHEEARLSLQARMATPDFDFANFPIVFTRTTSLPDGFRECTTWRFLGDAAGTFRVTMEVGNGLEGLASIPDAGFRSSNGTSRTTTWTDIRAFGVILQESDPQTGNSTASEPLESYEFSSSPRQQWSLRANGPTGDFTHCATRAESGNHDSFTFAALPENVNDGVASVTGEGLADLIVVDFEGATGTQTSRPFP